MRSLPQDSYFQIYSFGSHFEKMFSKSEKYTDSTLSSAIEKVNTIQANMGGTEIEAPLQEILNSSLIKGYPKQIFLLTDGQV